MRIRMHPRAFARNLCASALPLHRRGRSSRSLSLVVVVRAISAILESRQAVKFDRCCRTNGGRKKGAKCARRIVRAPPCRRNKSSATHSAYSFPPSLPLTRTMHRSLPPRVPSYPRYPPPPESPASEVPLPFRAYFRRAFLAAARAFVPPLFSLLPRQHPRWPSVGEIPVSTGFHVKLQFSTPFLSLSLSPLLFVRLLRSGWRFFDRSRIDHRERERERERGRRRERELNASFQDRRATTNLFLTPVESPRWIKWLFR